MLLIFLSKDLRQVEEKQASFYYWQLVIFNLKIQSGVFVKGRSEITVVA
jgi:hypothetical protein